MRAGAILRNLMPATLAASVFLSASAVGRENGSQSRSAGRMFQEAFLLEQGRGDLAGAIGLYDRLVKTYPNENALAARALMRLGICYELLGEAAAAQAYQVILDRYSDQSEIALEARRKLDQLRRGRGGAAAPPDSSFSLREFTVSGSRVFDGQAALSPDGAHLAYVLAQRPYPLIVADLTSGERRTVQTAESPDDPIAVHYRWSHDSRRLAFDAVTPDGGAIRVYDLQLRQSKSWVQWKTDTHVLLDWGTENDSIVCLVRDAAEWDIVLYGPNAQVLQRIRPAGLDCSDLRIEPRSGLAACSSLGESPDVVVFPLADPKQSRTVASHPGTDRSPVWSPDGRHLAFLSDRDQTGTFDLWAVGLDDGGRAGNPFLLVRDLGAGVRLQSWSQDGRLTFHKENRLRDIWSLPVDGVTGEVSGEASIVTTRQGRNFQPAASPSGRRVAFLSSDPDNNWVLGVADIDSSEEIFVKLDADSIFNPTWRGDGIVVLSAWDESGGYFLEFDVDRDRGRKVMNGPEFAALTSSNGWRRFPPHPDASPDGTSLLFSFAPDSWQSSSLYRFDGASLFPVPGSTGLANPRWSPDGRRIAFVDTRAHALEISAVDLSARRALVQLPPGESFGTFSWSPDGRSLVYPRFREDAVFDGDYWTLWIVSVDGGRQRPIRTPRGLNPWWIDWSAGGGPLIMGSLRGLPNFFVLENFWPATEPR